MAGAGRGRPGIRFLSTGQGWHVSSSHASSGERPPSLVEALDGTRWFQQLAVQIRRGGQTVYIDPNGIPDGEPPADIVLLTHPHFDVFSEKDIEKVRKDGTIIIAPASMKKLVPEGDHYLRPGDLVQLDGLDLLAVPAYNPRKRYHPRESDWLGYLFTIGGISFYHAGHTGLIPEMEGIRCDVALLPCDGRYSMTAKEAARAAETCGATVVVPLNWEGVPGGREMAEGIRSGFSGEVVLLEPTGERPTRH